ncbi:hypothetical protein SprV_0100112400 [Sparganum proliferum]
MRLAETPNRYSHIQQSESNSLENCPGQCLAEAALSRDVNESRVALPMDDEELAQDVLDQFDLVCTQYTATSEAPGLLGGFKLSKTSSLDANMSRCPGFDVRHHHQNEDEVQHLKDEIAALKEELYMKVGELSSLKEASSRNAAANLETVRKLKTQLASEREEARKTLTALGSQLAFREADYQLVASELAQAKEAMASQSLVYATDAPTTAATGTHTISKSDIYLTNGFKNCVRMLCHASANHGPRSLVCAGSSLAPDSLPMDEFVFPLGIQAVCMLAK